MSRHSPSHARERGIAAPFRCRLVIMTRAAVAGAAKTRIADALGVATAVRFTRHSAITVWQRVAYDPRWRTTLAVTPDAAATSRLWPPGAAPMPQGPGDLGARMQRILERAPP